MEANRQQSSQETPLDAVRSLKIERSSTAERLAEALRALIVRGELPPGGPLREGPLVEALGVSRNTLREAFRLLGRDGLVVHHMHRGIVVKQLTEEDVRDIYRTRLPLELVAVDRCAAVHREQLVPLRQALDRASAALQARDWKELATYDLYFHQALVSLIGSKRIDAFFAGLLAELRLAFAIPADQEAFLAPFLVWNEQICDLLERGEREACADELRAYLAEAERVICSFLRDQATAVRSPAHQR